MYIIIILIFFFTYIYVGVFTPCHNLSSLNKKKPYVIVKLFITIRKLEIYVTTVPPKPDSVVFYV